MSLRLTLTLFLLSCVSSLYAADFFGFQVINLHNLKDNTKCSGVLLNTPQGCRALTNAHCVRGLALGEENLIIAPVMAPEIHSHLGRQFYTRLVHHNQDPQRSFVIKAKPSSDLAQIHFDAAWASQFCQDELTLTPENSPRHRHVDEVYDQEEQTRPGEINQHLPGQPQRPNPTIYYRPSQNFLLMALGLQNDMPTLQSILPVSFDDFSQLSDKLKTRLNVEYASLPGIDFSYQVKGINLSQGMSGGALFEIEHDKAVFKGLAASFYPFQWISNFIPASYILDFLNDYRDDHSDQFEVSIFQQAQVAADQMSQKEEEKLLKLQEEGEIPSVVVVRKPRYELRPQNGPIRVPRTQVRFGDTDQDDVGGEVVLKCDQVASALDPFFDILPPVTNCFDLSQTRFQHSGVMAKELSQQIIIAYQKQQINGLSDLRALQKRADFNPNLLITRPVGGHPALRIRQNILHNFLGIYFAKENGAITNQNMYQYAHLGEGFTRQYLISPSSNALIRESVIHDTELYGELFSNIFNYQTRELEGAHDVNVKLKVAQEQITLGLKLTNQENYSFTMIPHFDSEFKRLKLQTTLIRYDQFFTPLMSEKFELHCDNRSFAKLICFNDKMEFGLSKLNHSSSLSIRLAFWDGFQSKVQALSNQNFNMRYTFGELVKHQAINRRVDLGTEFHGVKLKTLLANETHQLHFVEIAPEEILNYIDTFPRKIQGKLNGESAVKSFFYRDELFHLVHDNQKKYGVLYDRAFKVVGVIVKRKISTHPHDIF